MSALNPGTAYRLAVVFNSGFDNESAMGKALIETFGEIGRETSAADGLSTAQVSGVKGALEMVPIAYAAISDLIAVQEQMPAELRSNLHFMLIKLMDDLLSMGAVFGSKVGRDAEFSMLQRQRQVERASRPRPRSKSDARTLLTNLAAEHAADGLTANDVWTRMVAAIENDCADLRIHTEAGEIIIEPAPGDEHRKKPTSYKKSSFQTIFAGMRHSAKR